jgi:hypothetical protein
MEGCVSRYMISEMTLLTQAMVVRDRFFLDRECFIKALFIRFNSLSYSLNHREI